MVLLVCMKDIEARIEVIERRNNKVERDKAWETSATRRGSIALLTYVVVVSYLTMIDNDNPLINGLVPVAGFILSTLALGFIRTLWEKHKK